MAVLLLQCRCAAEAVKQQHDLFRFSHTTTSACPSTACRHPPPSEAPRSTCVFSGYCRWWCCLLRPIELSPALRVVCVTAARCAVPPPAFFYGQGVCVTPGTGQARSGRAWAVRPVPCAAQCQCASRSPWHDGWWVPWRSPAPPRCTDAVFGCPLKSFQENILPF